MNFHQNQQQNPSQINQNQATNCGIPSASSWHIPESARQTNGKLNLSIFV